MRTYLESVLPREALVAVSARVRLDRKMYALVTLQIVVSVEALRALVATERPVCLRVRLGYVVAVKLLHGSVSAVVMHWHGVSHAVDQSHRAVRVADI